MRLIFLAVCFFPAVLKGQIVPEGQAGHWGIKVAASSGSFLLLSYPLQVDSDLSALISTAVPTIIGKALYAQQGLGNDPAKRWPSLGFVARDIAGEFCVQSFPLWYRLAKGGPKSERIWRVPAAVLGYTLSLQCGRSLEVR